MHWARVSKHGTPEPDIATRMPKGASLSEKLDAFSTPVTESGCLLWERKLNSAGYGVVCHQGKWLLAHRVSWEIANGPIPEGLYVLHKCDTPACLRPEHLYIGSQKENIADCINRGRFARGEDNSKAGLTNRDVLDIRESEDCIKDIADKYGLHKRTVYAIRSKESWRHI